MDLSNIRREYDPISLDIEDPHSDPFEQFEHWYAAASDADVLEPNAMTLATVDQGGAPSQRIVLLKYFDRELLLS